MGKKRVNLEELPVHLGDHVFSWKGKYYFSDETAYLHGSYDTEEEARRYQRMYVEWLNTPREDSPNGSA